MVLHEKKMTNENRGFIFTEIDLNEYTYNKVEESRIAYNPPVSTSSFASYAMYLIFFGFIFMSLFTINIISPKQSERSLLKQIIFSIISSFLYGFGFIFLIMECGVYL